MITVASTLDELIASSHDHEDGSQCEYRLGKGQPLSRNKCQMCTRLSALIDLSVSWTQKIDTGRLTGRNVEIVEIPGVRTIRDAEATWKLYKECDIMQNPLLRRYYLSFTCGTGHYMLREQLSCSPPSDPTPRLHYVPPPLKDMIKQLREFFQSDNLPKHFVHGNPTVASISFIGRLPVALKKYSSRYLIQIDYGGGDSAALTALAARQGDISGDTVVTDSSRDSVARAIAPITIKRDATFGNFLRDYPRHWKQIGFFMMLRGLLSLYPSEQSPVGRSSARNLREAFEEVKGTTILPSASYDDHTMHSIS